MRTARSQGPWLGLGALLIMACLHLVGPGTVAAYDVQIHGYGNQDFIMTNKTNYFDAEEGTWNVNSMSLVFTGNVTDDTTIWAKVFAASEKTSMEWLYVNKKFGNGLDLRIGQMKLPMGIFNLVRDNRFVQLTETNPSMYSEDVDVVHENFRGAGLEYNNDWMTAEVFAGGPELDEEGESSTVWTGPNTVTNITREMELRNLYGGRLKVKTPLKGLAFMFSASTFEEERETTTVVIDILNPAAATTNSVTETSDENLWIASVEYERHGLEMIAEYARKSGGDEAIVSYYGEIGYTFAEKLTPYVRYDYITTAIQQKSEPANHQTDTTVGIGYKINDYFKVKAENHFINGYALAAARGDLDPADPTLPERWNMFVAGVNFMF